MENIAGFALLGTGRRTDVLKTIALLDETYAREIARVTTAPLISVQRVVDGLERDGVVVTRPIGVERRIALNPRFFAVKELKALLLRLSDEDDRLLDAVTLLRRRPRRRGKPL